MMCTATAEMIRGGTAKKGDVLGVARIAGDSGDQVDPAIDSPVPCDSDRSRFR